MGEQRTNLLGHVEKLTAQLQGAWDILAALLSGRLKMQGISVQRGDLILIFEPEKATPEMRDNISRASQNLARNMQAMGTPCYVLVCPYGMRVEALDPELLEAQGWHRSPEAPSPLPESSTTTP